MKKLIFCLMGVIMLVSTTIMAQDSKINKDDFNKTLKLIADSLPMSWSVKPDTAFPDEMIIQSMFIDLESDMTSNDGPQFIGQCEIFIMMLPRVSPDSINSIRQKNKALKDKLPPQVSKDNLQKWYSANEKTLKILDAEPTHYDKDYSYRMKCRRIPKNENDLIKYNQVIAYLNRLYKKY